MHSCSASPDLRKQPRAVRPLLFLGNTATSIASRDSLWLLPRGERLHSRSPKTLETHGVHNYLEGCTEGHLGEGTYLFRNLR